MNVSFYQAFGHRLSSTIPLPELRTAPPGPVRWRFSVVSNLPPVSGAILLGEDPLYDSVSARLVRHDAGFRIEVDAVGAFDFPGEAGPIRWQPTEDPWWDFGRSHLIGRVLVTSLHLSGVVTLHGSAVEMADGVVGFVAPKQFGKSTLGTRLLRAGARFVTDDALPLAVGGTSIKALPGIQSLRIRIADLENGDEPAVDPVSPPGRDGKVVLPPLPEECTIVEPTSLSCLYFLTPRPPSADGPAVLRRPSPRVQAAVRLLSQIKVGAMLGSGFAEELLDAAVTIVSRVPTYELSVVRDLERLDSVVRYLSDWHGLPDSGRGSLPG